MRTHPYNKYILGTYHRHTMRILKYSRPPKAREFSRYTLVYASKVMKLAYALIMFSDSSFGGKLNASGLQNNKGTILPKVTVYSSCLLKPK